MVELGLTLKQAREKKGYSLQEVAQLLKINARVLKAIEEGDTSQLPAPPFLRGFVKSYAHCVGVNVDLALKMMSDKTLTNDGSALVSSEPSPQAAETEVKPVQASSPSSPYSPPPLSQSPTVVKESNHRSFYMGALVVFLGVLTFGFYQLIQKYEEERQLDERSAVSIEPAIQEVSPEPPSSVTVAETSEQANLSSAESNSETTNAATNNQNSPTPAPSVPTPTVASVKPSVTPPASPASSAPTPAGATEAVANTETTSQQAPQTPLSEIIVEAKNSVEVTLTLASGRKQQKTLAPGQIYTLRTRGQTTLSASDGGAIQLIINGIDRGTPGTTGQPLNMKVIE